MKIKVTNIPVSGYASGLLTVPNGLEGEALQDAITKAVRVRLFVFVDSSVDVDVDVDEAMLEGKWSFEMETIE